MPVKMSVVPCLKPCLLRPLLYVYSKGRCPVLHGIGAGCPVGGWGIGKLRLGQTSLPPAAGESPQVRRFPAPDVSRLQQRHTQVEKSPHAGLKDRLLLCTACIEFTRLLVSDDSDDNDAALGTGLPLGPSAPHSSLTVKRESSEQEDGLTEVKPFNGVLLQGDIPDSQKMLVIP